MPSSPLHPGAGSPPAFSPLFVLSAVSSPLSPLAATLTSHVKHKSCVCHACKKHAGSHPSSQILTFRRLADRHSAATAPIVSFPPVLSPSHKSLSPLESALTKNRGRAGGNPALLATRWLANGPHTKCRNLFQFMRMRTNGCAPRGRGSHPPTRLFPLRRG